MGRLPEYSFSTRLKWWAKPHCDWIGHIQLHFGEVTRPILARACAATRHTIRMLCYHSATRISGA